MIKVFLQRGYDNTGKGKFLKRLADASKDIGVSYRDTPIGCDVLLDLAWWHGNVTGMPRVVRIDGASDKKGPLIKRTAREADAVIWQSNFCKKTLKERYGIKGKKEYVIYNGSNKELEAQTFSMTHKYNVIMCANWMKGDRLRKEKRLEEMLEIAIMETKKHDDICFYIAGKTPFDGMKHERGIVFLGEVGGKELYSHTAQCNAMLNLSKEDWCPNAVVECLVAGVPVIYAEDGGGIPEIVGSDGAVITEDTFVYEIISRWAEAGKTVNRPDLLIEEAAKSYKKVFEEVLR